MLLEHFDKCSDLKNFTDKTVTHRKLEGVSSEDIDKCSQLSEVIDEHNDYLYLYDDNNDNDDDNSNKLENLLNNLKNLNIGKTINLEDLKNKQIYIYIIMAFVVNFYLSLFIGPIIFSGSILISLCIVLLSILILFLLIYLFS
jgi:hypothetical protein|tara:strand:- start:346 stop:774 length:429 start_codon:yes stop_codon:yes gene_type:complete